ncbi:DUF6194 family protein [Brachybacterium sp. DNPG3]
MSITQILSDVRRHDDLLEIAPTPGSEHPPISWGDRFLYVAPDGQVPRTRQPFATITTKDYPEDSLSRLSAEGRWRVNIHVGRAAFLDLLGYAPEEIDASAADFAASDVLLPHPVYGAYGWICVVLPGARMESRVREALDLAYAEERQRVQRRG